MSRGRDGRATDHHLVRGTGPGRRASLVHIRAGPAAGSLLQIRVAPGRKRHLPRGEAPLLHGLARAGRRSTSGSGPGRVYSITDEGREALREWLATPVSPFAMDFEAMIRLFVAPLGTKEQIVTTSNQVRDDAQEMLRFGGEVKQEFLDGIAVTQDQVYIRALAVDFFISLLNTVEAWAERTLAGDRIVGRPQPRRKERAGAREDPGTAGSYAGIGGEDAGTTSKSTPTATTRRASLTSSDTGIERVARHHAVRLAKPSPARHQQIAPNSLMPHPPMA